MLLFVPRQTRRQFLEPGSNAAEIARIVNQPLPGSAGQETLGSQVGKLLPHVVHGVLPSGRTRRFQGQARFVIGFQERRDNLHQVLRGGGDEELLRRDQVGEGFGA